MHLRPHQTHALEVLRVAHQRSGSRVLVQSPCGTGKTVIAAHAVQRWIHRRGVHRALIAVPSIEIVGQFARRLRTLTRLPVAADDASARLQPPPRVLVTTYAALWAHLERFPSDALLVFDECHHGNQEAPSNLRLIERHAHVVGLSATPWSEGCRAVFGTTAHVTLPLSVAVREQLVAPYVVEPWSTPRGPFGLVFVAGNDAAARTARELGRGAGWVGVSEPASRTKIHAWRQRTLSVLVADRMCAEGFDAPECAEVWVGRNSESEILLVQIAGRALRYRPGKVARLHCQDEQLAERLQAALGHCDSPRLTLV